MASGKNIIVFLSSVRPNRMSERIGKHLKQVLTSKGMNPIMFDPAEMPFELLQMPIHFMKDPEEAPQWLKDAHDKIKSADGFIIASGEYNCSLPPALSNMMDHFPPQSYKFRPVGIVTYSMGPFGGIRAATLLRIFAAEFGMFPVPTSVVIPTIQNSIGEDGTVKEERVSSNVEKLMNELNWIANAIEKQTLVAPRPT